MGLFLKNFNGGEWYIEHKTNTRWYLFDLDKNKDITQMLWSQEIRLCLSWKTQELVYDFLDEYELSHDCVNVVNKLYLRRK